ncbi:hypothetical protein [Curtobacterium sp. Curtsp57]|uniref:hypothetical protein n=1 Tax=Curtobacterium sp. Curtsp57 TaxID=3243047 RepID=UPI0039B41C0C
MTLRSLATLDDATFDVTAARVADGRLVLHGWVEDHDTNVGTARLPVVLTVPDAVSVMVDDTGGTGELVLESIDVTATTVTLRGVIPCAVVVTTSVRSQALVDVGTTPIAVRRWGRWRRWDPAVPVILDYRAVSKRLRNTACPTCAHPWEEHPGELDRARTRCGECEYEVEHGERSPIESICTAQIPHRLVELGPSPHDRRIT